MVESVYCAVGTDSLCKAEYVWSLQVSKCKGRAGIVECVLVFRLSQSVWLSSRRETSLCSVPVSTKLDLLLFSCLVYLTSQSVVRAL